MFWLGPETHFNASEDVPFLSVIDIILKIDLSAAEVLMLWNKRNKVYFYIKITRFPLAIIMLKCFKDLWVTPAQPL